MGVPVFNAAVKSINFLNRGKSLHSVLFITNVEEKWALLKAVPSGLASVTQHLQHYSEQVALSCPFYYVS